VGEILKRLDNLEEEFEIAAISINWLTLIASRILLSIF
jgi:hypothetical protein